MASLSNDPNGTRRVLFFGPDGRRHAVRLGKLNKKQADSVRLRIEHLANAARTRLPLDAETAAWVGTVGDDLAAKLAAVGLIPARQSQSLRAFLEAYIAGRTLDSKPATVVTIRQVAADMTGFYGPDADLRAVTPAAADDLRKHYLGRELASATVARRLKMCRMLFGHAVARGIISANPFAGLKGPPAGPNADRQHYVSRGDAHRVLAVQPGLATDRGVEPLRRPPGTVRGVLAAVGRPKLARRPDGRAVAEDRTARRRRVPGGADLPGPAAVPA